MSRNSRFKAIAIATLACALSSCGGGDGGDSGSGGDPASALSLVNVNISAKDREVFEGEGFSFGAFGDLSGDLSVLSGRTLHVMVEDPQHLFVKAAVLAGSAGLGNSISVDGRQNLPPGTYAGTLSVYLCLDAACNSRIRNSPVSIPYAVTVLPGLKVSPSTGIVLETAFGSTAEAAVNVTLPAGATAWSGFLMAGSVQNGTFSFTQSDTPAPHVQVHGELACAGTFEAQVQVSAIGRTSSGREVPMVKNVPVTYRVATTGSGAMSLQATRNSLSINTTDRPSDSIILSAYRQPCFHVGPLVQYAVTYLPAGPNGNSDAGAARWLSYENNAGTGYRVQSTLTARRCTQVFPDPPGAPYQACLAPGRYEAIVQTLDYLSDHTEVQVPFPVTLTVDP